MAPGRNRACGAWMTDLIGSCTIGLRRLRKGAIQAMQVKVVVHEAEEGGFWAEVPALPGCVSQGESMDERLANVREAIQAWLATEPPS